MYLVVASREEKFARPGDGPLASARVSQACRTGGPTSRSLTKRALAMAKICSNIFRQFLLPPGNSADQSRCGPAVRCSSSKAHYYLTNSGAKAGADALRCPPLGPFVCVCSPHDHGTAVNCKV